MDHRPLCSMSADSRRLCTSLAASPRIAQSEKETPPSPDIHSSQWPAPQPSLPPTPKREPQERQPATRAGKVFYREPRVPDSVESIAFCLQDSLLLFPQSELPRKFGVDAPLDFPGLHASEDVFELRV